MEKNIIKIKQKIYKIMVSSVFLFLFFLISTVIIAFWLSINSKWYVIGLLFLFGIATLFCLLSWIGGFIFLKVNKHWSEINKIRKKAALDWGLFYFSILNKIESLLDKDTKNEEKSTIE